MSAVNKEKKNSDRAMATKKHIIDTYLKLMRTHVWNRISVKDLCTEASVTRGTFYQYFDSILDLMETIENDTICELQAVLNAAKQDFVPANVLFTSDFDRDFSIKPSEYSIAWFRFCMENKEKMYSLLNFAYSDELFLFRIDQILANYLAYFMKYEGLPDDAFRRHYLTLYASLYVNAFHSWMNDSEPEAMTAEDMALIVDSIRTGGLYTARRSRMEECRKKE